MSAEKEIVNFWCNKKGYFTINNIKVSSNRDVGIIALRFNDDRVEEINHIEVSCSIMGSIGSIGDSAEIENNIKGIVAEKFEDKDIIKALKEHIKNLKYPAVNRYIVLGNLPKSRKRKIIRIFEQHYVKVIEFENVLMEVFRNLDTKYYKNGILRTLQLIKYLFLNNPKNISDLMISDFFTSAARKNFLDFMLDNDEFIKEFRKTNEERLTALLKHSSVKNPERLAEIIETTLLNRRTRKPFLASLLGQEKIKKIVIETDRKRHEIPLAKFFQNS